MSEERAPYETTHTYFVARPGDDDSRRLAVLIVTPKLLVSMLKTLHPGPPRAFVIEEHPLPDDAHVLACHNFEDFNAIAILLHSSTFPPVPPGRPAPVLPKPVFRTVDAALPVRFDRPPKP